ncbi:hypothetical protein P171DRAFT_428630 [Karstenula rhodostoma CBS 690.94]|uniref:Uncharacterized protein n=1 Tax=Karstenula rhodostoma CBS 690.94 TaxID=1392251 RepID=A0A9P4UGI8_9PLEO|nr:hypothetical protein P171DRAFT_428630 [Karstenula rhodostoma CBS 690.94]
MQQPRVSLSYWHKAQNRLLCSQELRVVYTSIGSPESGRPSDGRVLSRANVRRPNGPDRWHDASSRACYRTCVADKDKRAAAPSPGMPMSGVCDCAGAAFGDEIAMCALPVRPGLDSIGIKASNNSVQSPARASTAARSEDGMKTEECKQASVPFRSVAFPSHLDSTAGASIMPSRQCTLRVHVSPLSVRDLPAPHPPVSNPPGPHLSIHKPARAV